MICRDDIDTPGWYWMREPLALPLIGFSQWEAVKCFVRTDGEVFLADGTEPRVDAQFVGPLVEPDVKSRLQEEKYHALIRDIAAAQRLAGVGVDLSDEDWKRLLVAAFKYDTDSEAHPELRLLWRKFGSARLLPMLGNRIGSVMVGEQTRRFPKALATAFIEWLQAFQDGVE